MLSWYGRSCSQTERTTTSERTATNKVARRWLVIARDGFARSQAFLRANATSMQAPAEGRYRYRLWARSWRGNTDIPNNGGISDRPNSRIGKRADFDFHIQRMSPTPAIPTAVSGR